MESFTIAIELPNEIKSNLKLVCCGLKQVEWNSEEELLLVIRRIRPINEQQALEIRDQLRILPFTPFSLSLQTVHISQSKGGHGKIILGATPSKELHTFCKETHLCLQTLGYPLSKR